MAQYQLSRTHLDQVWYLFTVDTELLHSLDHSSITLVQGSSVLKNDTVIPS